MGHPHKERLSSGHSQRISKSSKAAAETKARWTFRAATTVWERWEASVRTDMHSFDHPMFAAYDGFLFNYVAGIRMNECREAFGRITLTPCFVRDLDWAEAELDTVRGRISVHWERRGRGIRRRNFFRGPPQKKNHFS